MTDPRVLGREVLVRGRVITVRRDTVALPDGSIVVREVVAHPGAVGIVALDDSDRVAMVEQYRHPLGRRLWELPAGLLDVPGEPPQLAAARELVEEAGLEARDWSVLIDMLTSPGMTDEATRVFLARGLTVVPRPPGEAEEADLTLDWVPLEEAVRRVLAGEIRNGMAVAGILATAQWRSGAVLRTLESTWLDRP